MNSRTLREYIAEGAILLAVVAGAWFFFIDDRRRELAEVEAEINSAASVHPMVPAADVAARLIAETTDARPWIENVMHRNRAARNSSALYERIMSLARECGARVHRLSPAASSRETESARATRLVLAIDARYREVARLLDDLQQIDAHIRPVSVTATPVKDREDTCSVEIELEVLEFGVPTVLGESLEDST